jgi:hypothetical protein
LDNDFDPAKPENQMAIVGFCNKLRSNGYAKYLNCPMQNFHDWAKSRF